MKESTVAEIGTSFLTLSLSLNNGEYCKTCFSVHCPISSRIIWLTDGDNFSGAEDQADHESGNAQGTKIFLVVVVVAHQQEP